VSNLRRLIDRASKKKRPVPAVAPTRDYATGTPTAAIAGLATATRTARRSIDHDTVHESAEHEDEQELDGAGETITELGEIMEIIKTDAVWKDFAEEFGEDVVRAVVQAQDWARRGNDIVDSDGNVVDLKMVRRLLEEHMSGSRAHGQRAAGKGADKTSAKTDQAPAQSAAPAAAPAAKQ
jgi:hypothetical protein